jgi:hypothetical protein
MKTFKTPIKHTELPLLNLKGKDYLQVAHRIVWFRETHPDWTIKTQINFSDESYSQARAEILNAEGRLIASAHKSETAKGFADHLEKSETGAIGRALALCGFGTQFCADEIDEGVRLADSPVNIAPKSEDKSKYLFPSDKQIKRLYAIASSKGWNDDDVHAALLKVGFASVRDLPTARYEGFCKFIESNPKDRPLL